MQWFGKKSAQRALDEKRPDGKDRLPPGQYLTKKWPVLSYERTPQQLPPDWKLKVTGKVEHPLELTWEEFLALPRTTFTADIHCVTTWSRYDNSCKKYGQIFHAHMFCFNLRPLEPASLPTNPTGREVLLRST